MNSRRMMARMVRTTAQAAAQRWRDGWRRWSGRVGMALTPTGAARRRSAALDDRHEGVLQRRLDALEALRRAMPLRRAGGAAMARARAAASSAATCRALPNSATPASAGCALERGVGAHQVAAFDLEQRLRTCAALERSPGCRWRRSCRRRSAPARRSARPRPCSAW